MLEAKPSDNEYPKSAFHSDSFFTLDINAFFSNPVPEKAEGRMGKTSEAIIAVYAAFEGSDIPASSWAATTFAVGKVSKEESRSALIVVEPYVYFFVMIGNDKILLSSSEKINDLF